MKKFRFWSTKTKDILQNYLKTMCIAKLGDDTARRAPRVLIKLCDLPKKRVLAYAKARVSPAGYLYNLNRLRVFLRIG